MRSSAATLPLRIEALRQLRRRRTVLTLGFLVLLPFLLVGAFALGSSDPNQTPGQTSLVDLATSGAANFTIFTLFASTGFLLVVVVALYFGDTVASEASWGTLRYLLAAPVPRGRLLRQKLLVAMAYAGGSVVLLPVVALLTGAAFYGWHPVHTPLGETFTPWSGVARIALVTGYVIVSLLVVGVLGFLLSTWTDAPLGAVGGAVALVVVSNILDSVTALGRLRSVLPTHYEFAWVDALSSPISYEAMAKGALSSLAYTVVFLAGAFWHFARKDVLS